MKSAALKHRAGVLPAVQLAELEGLIVDGGEEEEMKQLAREEREALLEEVRPSFSEILD